MGLDQIDTNKWMVNINSDEDLRVHGLHQIGGSKSIWLLIQRSERGMDNEVVGSSKIWTLTFQFQILPMPVAQFGSKSKSSWYSRSNMAIYGYIYIYMQYYAILIYYYVAVLLPQHQDVCEMLAKSKVFVDSSCFISPFSRVDPVPCSVSPVESSQVRFDTTWRTISGNWWVWAWANGLKATNWIPQLRLISSSSFQILPILAALKTSSPRSWCKALSCLSCWRGCWKSWR